jgi:tRNA(Ile)-lysidine synthase TilS/MesJ
VAGVIDALVARAGDTIARERLLAPGEPVLALVSGGADSTFLAHALARLGHPLELLHVAHALRRRESEEDAAAVAVLAGRLGVPYARADAPVADGPDLERRAREVARSRRGTRATTASRRSSTASRPRRARQRSAHCRRPTAPAASAR